MCTEKDGHARDATYNNDDHAAMQILLARAALVLVERCQPVGAVGPGLGQSDAQHGSSRIGKRARRDIVRKGLCYDVDGHGGFPGVAVEQRQLAHPLRFQVELMRWTAPSSWLATKPDCLPPQPRAAPSSFKRSGERAPEQRVQISVTGATRRLPALLSS